MGIKIDHAGVAVAANECGHVVHVGFRRHRLHGGGDVVIDELMPDMRIEDRSEVHCLRFLCLLHFLCFLHFLHSLHSLHQSLPQQTDFCRLASLFGAHCRLLWIVAMARGILPTNKSVPIRTSLHSLATVVGQHTLKQLCWKKT
jgi:hypothetical protein